MLVWHNIVFVFRIGRLVLWRDVDFLVGKVRRTIELLLRSSAVARHFIRSGCVDLRSYFEQVRETRLSKMDVRVRRVFGLQVKFRTRKLYNPRQNRFHIP